MASNRMIPQTISAGALHTAVALVLVAATLAPTLLGRAGFQAIERAMAARIFVLHQHGVPGEAEYIRTYRAPAPFVHHHCHGPLGPDGPETPAQLALGGLLFGPALCGAVMAAPAPPTLGVANYDRAAPIDDGPAIRPLAPPPRA